MKSKWHELRFKDIPQGDLNQVKERAIFNLVETAECSQVNLIVEQFMDYLQTNGYKIVKAKKRNL